MRSEWWEYEPCAAKLSIARVLVDDQQSPGAIGATHTSHSKGITVYLTESSAQRPALLLSVKRDLHTVLYLYFQ